MIARTTEKNQKCYHLQILGTFFQNDILHKVRNPGDPKFNITWSELRSSFSSDTGRRVTGCLVPDVSRVQWSRNFRYQSANDAARNSRRTKTLTAPQRKLNISHCQNPSEVAKQGTALRSYSTITKTEID
jgi:hypothetical protein